MDENKTIETPTPPARNYPPSSHETTTTTEETTINYGYKSGT